MDQHRWLPDNFCEKITNAEVVKISNTSYVINLEPPELLAAALIRWGCSQTRC